MTEKVRSLNLTTGGGNMLTTSATQIGSSSADSTASGGYSLIGEPTLISSTFSSNTQPLAMAVASTAPGADETPTNERPYSLAAAPPDAEALDYGPATSQVVAQLNFHLMPASTADLGESNSIMNSSQISSTSNDSMAVASGQAAAAAKPSAGNGKHLAAQSVAGKSCRFPKLEECAHFHYERVQLGPLTVSLVDDKSELLNSSIASQSIGGDIARDSQANTSSSQQQPSSFRSFSPTSCWFIVRVEPHRCDSFLVKRSFDNMQMFDEMLHRCVYDRKISGLKNLSELEFKSEEDVEYAVAKYLERFSNIASDSLTCGTILTWLQLDNKGRRLPLADGDTMRTINTPAVGAAYGVRRYQAQASDEISIEVGDMISVIDMPSPAESIWWRGKKSHLQKSHYEVGFFPQSCVATIGDKVPRHFPMPAPLVGQLDVSPTKPVLRKHGKLIAFFRSFILSRPSRRRLKQSGIYRERVFSCDLSEHLLNSGQEIPMVLKCCAEFLEAYGIVDGIYRLSGITSNIQRLRSAFDEERIPDLGNPEMKQDIHAVSSLLKMYFRELPNPLCTYQLYDNFVEAIQAKSESNERLRLMKETVLKLPPPHYRTLKYLSEHLNKISQHHNRTGMTDKNLAIVWAPNLLRSPALESGGVAALRGVGVQAVVTEYLIRNCHNIFDALEESNIRLSYLGAAVPASAAPAASGESRLDSLTDCESLLVEQREHDQSLSFVERPKSLSTGGPKLISLEEAQERHSRLDSFDMKQSMPISMVSSNPGNIGSYIEVGGGPSSLPDKYHTVISAPRSWQKRKTHSWKSIFTRNPRAVPNGAPGHELKTPSSAGGRHDPVSGYRKEPSQVTFAEADLIINASGKPGKALSKLDKPKSIELFDTSSHSYGGGGGAGGDMMKPMDICVRSNSIDSLRTAGHSRSVSHDSYFDLLQSPQRGHVTTCPSRELSELGLNFDREEPEMRIFSESESLVSSPRVGKENIPPTSRRIMRARPEEFSSQTNSVNPSPKKQPRLNLLLSPSSASQANWPKAPAEGTGERCHEHGGHVTSDESCCKRYKLEDQLSDIQYIDCGTPEHSNPQTLYASVQVHAPPKSALSKGSLNGGGGSTDSGAGGKLLESPAGKKPSASSNYEKLFTSPLPKLTAIGATSPSTNTTGRYSYPSTLLASKPKDSGELNAKERFSYPGSVLPPTDRRYSAKDPAKRYDEEEAHKSNRSIDYASGKPKLPPQAAKVLPDLLRAKNRNSFCGSANAEQVKLSLLRNSSSEINKEPKINEMERSKLSVTPSSPVQSPRYSLLVGETSSENSSAVNTPQYDLDPLMISSAMSGMSALSSNSSNHQQQLQRHQLLGVDLSTSLATSHESLGSQATSTSNITTEKRDMNALKRELSLDLKIASDHTDSGSHAQRQHQPVPQLVPPSPSNNSNFTDNTSQSATPSEYGYQNLQRQLSMHSLLETEENSPTYEDYENTPSNMVSPLGGGGRLVPISPIKSTISITYNLKSPKEEQHRQPFASPRDKTKGKPLLETSFDENTVYEQVKIFRNSVTEVNQLLTDGKPSLKEIEEAAEVDKEVIDDILMSDTGSSLYENVELRKPQRVYENLVGEEMKRSQESCKHEEEARVLQELEECLNEHDNDDEEEDDGEEEEESEKEKEVEEACIARKSPSNFSVKELATKFESSPVEQAPAFDFSVRNSIKKPSVAMPTPEPPKAGNQQASQNFKQKLSKSQQITRSLDENAFVREFGAKHLHELNTRNSSIQQLPELSEGTTSSRRKSFDFTRPKTLNPPKRLPGMPITEEICHQQQQQQAGPLKLDFTKERSQFVPNHRNEATPAALLGDTSSLEHDFDTAELKITPTTENRISLIQNNVASDVNNCNQVNSGLKVLSGVKLDRERIDKIKEERRQQLTQKYRGETTFKSRSKTDLHTTAKEEVDKFHADAMRVKSKSRGDMRALQKDMDNRKDFERSMSIGGGVNGSQASQTGGGVVVSGVGAGAAGLQAAGSESTLSTQPFGGHRVRSISDEKNQNSEAPATTVADGKEPEEFSARATAQKFERRSYDYANGGGSVGGGQRERRQLGETAGAANVIGNNLLSGSRSSLSSTREKISPQFSIRDMTAMFESRSQNQ